MASSGEGQVEGAEEGASAAPSQRLRVYLTKLKSRALLSGSNLWLRLTYARRKYRIGTEAIVWLALIAIGWRAASNFQASLAARFQSADALDDLNSLLQGTGTALIGGTAIAASLVLFAMQVNVERLPYGLFRRLSDDAKLLTAFAGSFVVALLVASLSLVSTSSFAAFSISLGILGSAIVLRLFLYAYRRSLALISPAYQLHLIRADVRREAQRWSRRARWAAPLMADGAQGEFDGVKFAAFRVDPRLRSAADRGISHAVGMARKLVDQGDELASNFALQAVVEINRIYIDARGRSFFANTLIGDNSAVTDPIINQSIDQLKHYFRFALSRRDEDQMIETLRKLRSLTGVYLAIEYTDLLGSKTHACIAARQLQTEVESLVPHQMPDALYRAIGVLGGCAADMIERSRPEDGVELIQKIGTLGCTGAARDDHLVITHTAMDQLSQLTFALLRVQDYEINYAISELVQSATVTTRLVLASSHYRESPISSPLSQYYSGVADMIREVANELLKAESENQQAQKIVSNIAEWADELNQPVKELLLLSVKQQSLFTLKLIQFVQNVTEALLAIASAPCCPDHERDDLQKHALWLVGTLSWVPNEADDVAHLENMSLAENLFELALAARRWSGDEVLAQAKKQLLNWSLAATPHRWDVLETGIYGLSVLAVLAGPQGPEEFFAEFEAAIGKTWLGLDVRDKVARDIRSKAEYLRDREYETRSIERGLASVDRDQIKSLLNKVANLLSPGTKEEPVRSQIL